jgi:hypothetical protein
MGREVSHLLLGFKHNIMQNKAPVDSVFGACMEDWATLGSDPSAVAGSYTDGEAVRKNSLSFPPPIRKPPKRQIPGGLGDSVPH